MAYDVFLSYARTDIQRAEVVKDLLEGLGLSVFFDTEGLDSGDIFPDILDREVKSAGAVVGVWSKHALTRPWVKIECDIGKTRGVLVPIQIEQISDLDRPAAFWNIQFSDLSDFEGDTEHAGWLRFIRSLARTLDRPDLLERESAAQAAEPETDDARVRAELDALRSELSDLRQAKTAAATPPPSVDPTATNLALWQEIKNTENPAAMRRFLETVRGTPLEHVVEAQLTRLENKPAVSKQSQPASTEPGEPSDRKTPLIIVGVLAALALGVAAIILPGQFASEPNNDEVTETTRGGSGSPNSTDSVAYHEQSCRDGIPAGCQQAATAYVYGEGVVIDRTRASELYAQGCDLDDAESCWLGGIVAEQDGELEKAEYLYDEACDLGDTEGCGLLDDLQEMQAEQAYEAAITRLQRALIAKDFLNGLADGVAGPQTERAVEAFRTEAGYSMRVALNAQNTWNIDNLASAVERWVRPPATNTSTLPSWAQGLPNSTTQSRADGCMRNIAQDCYFLGEAYRDAEGLTRDHATANLLFEMACDGGFSSGCYSLGWSYAEGRAVPLNYDKAIRLFDVSCNDGIMEGCTYLGTLYYEGRGVQQDRVRAKELHTKACDGGLELACNTLEVSYD